MCILWQGDSLAFFAGSLQVHSAVCGVVCSLFYWAPTPRRGKSLRGLARGQNDVNLPPLTWELGRPNGSFLATYFVVFSDRTSQVAFDRDEHIIILLTRFHHSPTITRSTTMFSVSNQRCGGFPSLAPSLCFQASLLDVSCARLFVVLRVASSAYTNLSDA